MECFVIIVNGFQPLTIITKRSILDVVAAQDPPLKGNELTHDNRKFSMSTLLELFAKFLQNTSSKILLLNNQIELKI